MILGLADIESNKLENFIEPKLPVETLLTHQSHDSNYNNALICKSESKYIKSTEAQIKNKLILMQIKR